jgi:hypothetical protein
MRSAYFIVAVWGAAKPLNKVSPRISTLENVPSTALAATRAPAGPSISHNNAGFSPCQRTANEMLGRCNKPVTLKVRAKPRGVDTTRTDLNHAVMALSNKL